MAKARLNVSFLAVKNYCENRLKEDNSKIEGFDTFINGDDHVFMKVPDGLLRDVILKMMEHNQYGDYIPTTESLKKKT